MKQRKLWAYLFVFVCLALSSCGGGTSGTGIQGALNTPVFGRVLDREGHPVAGANISVAGSAENVTSDEDGNFTVESLPDGAMIDVTVGDDTFQGEVSYPDAPVSSDQSNPSGVTITIDGDGSNGDLRKSCFVDSECGEGFFCRSPFAQCGGSGAMGFCVQKPEACTEIWAPVCGCDGETYSSECFANGSGISVSYIGECVGGGAITPPIVEDPLQTVEPSNPGASTGASAGQI